MKEKRVLVESKFFAFSSRGEIFASFSFIAVLSLWWGEFFLTVVWIFFSSLFSVLSITYIGL